MLPSAKRPQVLPRQMLVWLQVKAGVTPSGTQLYTHPQLEGSGVLSPRPWGQLLPPAPCPLVPHSRPLTSSLLLGSQGSSSHASCPSTVSRAACPWPPGGVPGSQAAWPPSRSASLASAGSALPAQQGSAGPGRGLAGGSSGTAHNLPFLVVGAGGCLRVMLCRLGLRLVRPQAVCSSLI